MKPEKKHDRDSSSLGYQKGGCMTYWAKTSGQYCKDLEGDSDTDTDIDTDASANANATTTRFGLCDTDIQL